MAETNSDDQNQPSAQSAPGAVVYPDASPAPTPATPEVQPAPEAPAQEQHFASGFDTAPQGPDAEPPQEAVSWSASEYVAHEKNAGWYLAVAGAAVLLAALIYLVTRDVITGVVIIMVGVALAGYGARKPKEINYQLDAGGITIGGKHFLYQTFRSFSVIPEGAFSSIVFMPMRRFALPLTLYYAPDDEDKIISLLADRLPFEERRPDAVDSFMRRIRF